MTVAITGATGFVGQAVLDEAAARDIPLKALTRRDQPVREGVEWVAGDLADPDALARLAEGARAVIHIAGVINAPGEAGFMAGNVTGTENVVAAARTAGVERFVHVSSLAAREPGLSVYGKSKRLAEEVVQVSGLDWSMVRPPTVYGPRDRETFEIFRMATKGIVPMPSQGRSSIVHASDLARLLLDLTAATDSRGEIYEVDDGREGGWSHDDLARAIGDAVGRKVRVLHVPPRVLRLAARMAVLVQGDNAKLTLDRVSYMVHPDWTSDAARAVPQELWQPEITTAEGLRQTAEWYRRQGWL